MAKAKKPTFVYPAVVRRITDGDTVVVDFLLPYRCGKSPELDMGFNIFVCPDGLWMRSYPVRLMGCNCAEKGTEAGNSALLHLSTLVRPGDKVLLQSKQWDKYGGRIDGDLVLLEGERSLTGLMIASGHAKPWNGKGTRPI